jgi:uncharacterized protein (TIGR02284 family)
MDYQRVITTLNNLLETTKDGENGFRACVAGVTNPRLKEVLERAAMRCDEGAIELESKIRSLGGEPATSGTFAGSVHRVWTNVISSISGMSEQAVLSECERGEEFAERAYEAALQEPLPPDIEQMVRRQYEGVRRNHTLVRDLRNEAAQPQS